MIFTTLSIKGGDNTKRVLIVFAVLLCFAALVSAVFAEDQKAILEEKGFVIREDGDTVILFYDMENGDIDGVSVEKYTFDDDAKAWFSQYARHLVIALQGNQVYAGTSTIHNVDSVFASPAALFSVLNGSGLDITTDK